MYNRYNIHQVNIYRYCYYLIIVQVEMVKKIHEQDYSGNLQKM